MTGENPEVMREEPDPVPLHPTWISHNIAWVPQLKHSVSVAKTNQLMLFRELIAVCSEICIKGTSTLCV